MAHTLIDKELASAPNGYLRVGSREGPVTQR
jgi:hypothetical protein